MSVTVYTWANGSGHNALRIDGKKWMPSSQYPHTYISWGTPKTNKYFMDLFRESKGNDNCFYDDLFDRVGPNAQKGLQDGKMVARPGQVLLNNQFVEMEDGNLVLENEDKDFDDVQPAVVGSLRESILGGCGVTKDQAFLSENDWGLLPRAVKIHGLDDNAIMGWWLAFSRGRNLGKNGVKPGEDYQAVSKYKNCASMVLRALVAGGADLRKAIPTSFLVYTPPQIERYAKSLQYSSEAITISDNNLSDIPSYDEWYEISNSSLNFCKRILARNSKTALSRNIEMTHIDDLILEWHKKSPKNPSVNKNQKLNILQNLFTWMGNYFRTKPYGDRTKAVTVLAKRIYLMLQNSDYRQYLHVLLEPANINILF